MTNLGILLWIVNSVNRQWKMTSTWKPWLLWVTASHLYVQFLPYFGFRVFEVWYLMKVSSHGTFLNLCLSNVLMFISYFAEGSTRSLWKTMQQQNNCKRQLTGSRWILELLPLPAGNIICWFSTSHFLLRRMIEGFHLEGVSCVRKFGKKHYSSGCVWV